MATFLHDVIDYARHNEEVRAVMDSYNARRPIRVPLIVQGSITNYFFNPELNTSGLSFERFFKDPDVQIRAQLAHQYWLRHHVVCDLEMGLPEKWGLRVDFQNSYDASWAGAPVLYIENQLPDTEPIFADRREKLYDMPKILPADGGVIGEGISYIDYMEDYCRRNEFMGRPIAPPRAYPGEGCDGALDLAYKLRGAENVLLDMLDEDGYYEDLMTWITDNLIRRMRALRALHRARWGDDPGFGFADDAVTMLSHDMYKKYVLPYHKRIFDEFSNGKKCGMHLCGANMQHYESLVRELPIDSLDTGFPVDHGLLRRQVGPDVTLYTGPTVMLLQTGSADAIRAEAKRILESGVTEGGRYVMIAANNMAPRTPVENIQTLYDAVRTYGIYKGGVE
jgi:hypothetical protein